jgi:hypothetical protein
MYVANGNGHGYTRCVLTFKTGTFYAKIIAVLRDTSDVRNTSTMILEVSGGTHDGSTGSMYDIALGPQAIMGASGNTQYPWSGPLYRLVQRGFNLYQRH